MVLRIAMWVWLLALAAGACFAQSIRIGVVADLTGSAALGDVEAVVDAFRTRISSAGGVFGVPVEILLRDGRGEPRATAAALRALVDDEQVHALVCCTSPSTADRLVEVAEGRRVPGLSLSPAPSATGAWVFSLAPDERTELRAVVSHVFAEGKRAIGLMTLDNAFGAAVERALREELGVAGIELVASETYPPDVDVLTPEALWVATRQPGAVVVWGLPADTAVAVDALRRRGFAGPVYVRSASVPGAARSGREVRPRVRVAVAPVAAVPAVPDGHPAAEPAAALADFLRGLYGLRDVDADAARIYDALRLLVSAAEQAALYGVDPSMVDVYRQALLDAAISLPPFPGAGGLYDLQPGRGVAAEPSGLVVIEAPDGGA